LILTIVLVIAAEGLNTAVETLVDFISPGHDPRAGKIKDLTAGAVLVTAIGSIVVGFLIFLPKLNDLLSKLENF
jgi:diacylglycerol kinase